MSLYYDSNNTINRYFLEIEKYLPQLTYNPYLQELKDDIHINKKKQLLLHMNSKFHSYINELSRITIYNIFKQLYDIHNLNILQQMFDHIQKNKIKNINNYINKYINTYTQNNIENPILNPTSIRISTMTICCYLDQLIDLNELYTVFTPPYDINVNNYDKIVPKLKAYDIIGCKYDDAPNKGYFKKNNNKNFYNSASLNIYIRKDKQINFKIFKNGKIQITGIPKQEVAKQCIDAFIQYLYKRKIISTIIKYNNFRTVLINSDYCCGIEINRENLFKILTKQFNLTVSYESENYPGVKLAYFYNTNNTKSEHEGTCVCSIKCRGKGQSSDITKCKRITIAIFQSGKIIITGANSLEQIQHAYTFINSIIQKYYYLIIKKAHIKIKTYKIKLHTITNYSEYLKMAVLQQC